MQNGSKKGKPVAITGMGVITPHGSSIDPLWNDLVSGHSYIEKGIGPISDSIINAVRQEQEIQPFAEHLFTEKPLLMLTYSIQQAMKSAGWESLNQDDGFILSSTTGLVPYWEERLIQYLDHKIPQAIFCGSLRKEPLGVLLQTVGKIFNIQGPKLLLTTACSASTQALIVASEWIRSGKVKRCLVGGCEVLGRLTIEGFDCFKLLSRDRARPFSQNRTGINLSEGCGVICLERSERREDEKSLAYILGGSTCLDSYHMTAPHPEGQGILRAMKEALQYSHLSIDEIDWIHAHGTGSYHNDLAEGKAIQECLGPLASTVPVTSTKSIHGHMLAASGVVESIICVKALLENKIIENHLLETPDEQLCQLYFPRAFQNQVENATGQKNNLNYILKTSLGFGGSNVALVLEKGKWK